MAKCPLDLRKMTLDNSSVYLVAQGKEHLLVRDYKGTAQYLETTIKQYNKMYGTGSDECAEPYFTYGQALVDLHRYESGELDIVEKPEGEDERADEYLLYGYALLKQQGFGRGYKYEVADEKIEDKETSQSKPEEGESKDEPNGTAKEEDISPTPADAQANTNGSAPAPEISNGNASTAAGPSTTEQQLAGPSSAAGEMKTDVDPNQPSTSTGITDDNRAEKGDSAPSNIEVAIEVLSMARDIYKKRIKNDDIFDLSSNLVLFKEYYYLGLAYSLNNNVQAANENFEEAIKVMEMCLAKVRSSFTAESDEIKRAYTRKNIIRLEKERKKIVAKLIMNVMQPVKRKREETDESESSKKLKNGSENGTNGHTTENVEMKE